MNTNSALIVPAQSSAATNTAPLVFHDVLKPLIAIPNVWLWIISIAAVIVVAVAAWLFWRYRRNKAAAALVVPPVPPHVRARRRLERALSLISEPKPFSIAVSDALRAYLEERFNFHAPERTTEEFLYELQSTNLLTVAQKQSLAEFLESCDLIKFAKYEPAETALRALHDAALRLVNETEPRWVPPAAEPAPAAATAGATP
jgi:hypothetical protein